MKIGYGKVGRSMPLSLAKCGTLGGDVEMAAVVKTLAERNPDHTFVLVGRNDGSEPADVGLPPNVENPWIEWAPRLAAEKVRRGVNHGNLSVEDHMTLQDIYDELTLPTITGLDDMVLWAGQHGTTNAPIPGVRNPAELTKPHDWSAHYCSYLLRGINVWRDVDPCHREEVWLNADPRNYLKMRDLKWPLRHPVLAQRTYEHNLKHERYGDGSGFNEWYVPDEVDVAEPGMHTSQVWRSRVRVVYSRLEINGLVPGSPFGDLVSYDDTWEDRGHFGLFVNEARRYVAESKSRLAALRDWALPLEPTWVHGTWSAESQERLGVRIEPAPWELYYPRLHSVRCTLTTPSSGSGWATTKPWEAFAAGTVCFFHPAYDDQNNVLSDAPSWLGEWLRVSTPDELRARVAHLSSRAGYTDWAFLVRAQREHFDRAVSELTYARMVEERLFGGDR